MISSGLFNLPGELLSSLVTDWLKWNEVYELDRVICNRMQRKDWLGLLKERCIFKSVSLGYYTRPPDNFAWSKHRQIRVHGFLFDSDLISENQARINWFLNTAQYLESLVISTKNLTPINPLLLSCRHLEELSIDNGCIVDDTFWELIYSNPNLTALHLKGLTYGSSVRASIQALPNITTMSVHFDPSYPTEQAVVFMEKLPSIHSLKLALDDRSDVYKIIPETCPMVEQLDLSWSEPYRLDNNQFVHLIKSLKSGLRCLVFPEVHNFNTTEVEAIVTNHAHTLHCLHVQDDLYLANDTVVWLVNHLPHLHTLHIGSIFAMFTRQIITNPALTHIMLDFSGFDTDQLYKLSVHCSHITHLSLCKFRPYTVVKDVKLLLELCPLIHTVCVDHENSAERLRKELPHIIVSTYVGVNIFTREY